MGKIMDAAFIDRDDPKAAVEGLQKVEELARKGLSILIAPEGTRLDTTEVGPFKKGPFRIAMSAGIPIVPIVIRNAEVIAARDSSTFNPGTVDVAVFPPIPVDDWTHDNLSERIAEVRQLYLDTLKDWPHDELPDARAVRARRRRREEGRRRRRRRAKKAPAKKAAAKKAADEDSRRRRRPPRRTTQKRCREGPAVKVPADQFAPLHHHRRRAGAGVGVVAGRSRSCSTTGWNSQRREHPDSKRRGAAASRPTTTRRRRVLARLVEQLEADEDRSVVPVRVFWVPGGLPTRSKVVALLSGRDTYRPPELLQQPHPAEGPVARPGGRRRAREGVRTAPAVERHHGRREPQGIRAIRHPPRHPGDRTRRAAPARARSTSRHG